MKLVRLEVENFRRLGRTDEPFVLDFTDAMGRVRDFTLLVGPNTVGKTTALDAIAAAIGPTLELEVLRRDFVRTPEAVVRRGEVSARVRCQLRFTEAEVQTARELFRQPDVQARYRLPDPQVLDLAGRDVYVAWEYPDPQGRLSHGHFHWEPWFGWALLKSRVSTARLLRTGRGNKADFRDSGCVFTFDQQRTGGSRTVSRQLWNIVHGADENNPAKRRTADPRTMLLDLALLARLPSLGAPAAGPREFDRVVAEYARVCAPHRIVGAVEDERGDPDLVFTDGSHEYRYDGLSSGERMALLLLIRFVSENIHRSVVLIDELELNQHPVWQRKLLHLLPQMGEDNQIIATTHSPYLRDAVRPDAVIDLGDLGDRGAG